MTEFGPEGCEGQLCSLGDTCVIRWDIGEGLKEKDRIALPKRSSPAAIRWNPHSNGKSVEQHSSNLPLPTHERRYREVSLC